MIEIQKYINFEHSKQIFTWLSNLISQMLPKILSFCLKLL